MPGAIALKTLKLLATLEESASCDQSSSVRCVNQVKNRSDRKHSRRYQTQPKAE